MTKLDLRDCKLEGYRYARSIEVCRKLSHYSNLANLLWSYPYDQRNFDCFCLFLAGELPLSIIKMKTQGVDVQLSGNTGFTLPTNMNELGDIQKLDLIDCSLKGPFFYSFGDGRTRTTNLILTVFCPLLPQGAFPSPLGTLGIWRS